MIKKTHYTSTWNMGKTQLIQIKNSRTIYVDERTTAI